MRWRAILVHILQHTSFCFIDATSVDQLTYNANTFGDFKLRSTFVGHALDGVRHDGDEPRCGRVRSRRRGGRRRGRGRVVAEGEACHTHQHVERRHGALAHLRGHLVGGPCQRRVTRRRTERAPTVVAQHEQLRRARASADLKHDLFVARVERVRQGNVVLCFPHLDGTVHRATRQRERVWCGRVFDRTQHSKRRQHCHTRRWRALATLLNP
mmetsp:Transcript_701/g.1053  ORF Transcript_701/g.1053 Transcript_701/m.1053 type:complete len:212 (-) Transcript_701:392-1027(-)